MEKANNFFPRTGFLPRALIPGCTRLAVKLDFITGLLIKATEIMRLKQFAEKCMASRSAGFRSSALPRCRDLERQRNPGTIGARPVFPQGQSSISQKDIRHVGLIEVHPGDIGPGR